MRCLKCKYEPTMTEMQASPGVCPSCGVNYEKYAQALKASGLRVKGEKRRQESDATPSAAGGDLRVVVTDINMNFWSMVVFMVKWAFAAIPAMVIIVMIWVMLFMFAKDVFFN